MVLDPGFKRLLFVPRAKHDEVHDKLKAYLKKYLDNSTAGDQRLGRDVRQPQTSRMDFFSQSVGERSSDEELYADNPEREGQRPEGSRVERDIDCEFSRYMVEPAANNARMDPLEWWRVNKERYPLLVDGIKSLLCIPASNVPAESTQSTAGFICNKTRASLLPENVSMLVFLKRNKHFVDELVHSVSD